MKLIHLCSITLFTLNFSEASEFNSNCGEPSVQRQSVSNLLENVPAPLVLSAPLETMYEHALSKISTRSPADSGVEIDIQFHNSNDSIQSICMFVRSMLRIILHRNRILSRENGKYFWDLRANADLSEIKLFGFIVGLALKHEIPFPIRLSPMLHQVMTGTLNHSNLMEVLKETDSDLFYSLSNLSNLSAENLMWAELNFKDFGFPDKAVTPENVDRYIRLKVKTILYHPREQALANFVNGFKLVIPISVINRHYSLKLIDSILFTSPDYSAADLRQCFEPIQDYNQYVEQYEWFFAAVKNLTKEKRCNLLKLFTNFDYIPYDQPKFNISFVPTTTIGEHNRPRGYPCQNRLLLSPAESYEQMVEDLNMIISYF